MIDTILVPLDGSELAERALQSARALALRYDAGLVVAHVHEPAEPIILDDLPATDDQLRSLTRQHEQAYLERVALEAAPDGRPPVKVVLLEGSVARSLSDCADRNGVDLIVLTTHGRTGFERAWLGSVTDALTSQQQHSSACATPGRRGCRWIQPDRGSAGWLSRGRACVADCLRTGRRPAGRRLAAARCLAPR